MSEMNCTQWHRGWEVSGGKDFGGTTVAFGYGLLVWGLVDRPLMIVVAAVFIICGYASLACPDKQLDKPSWDAGEHEGCGVDTERAFARNSGEPGK